MIWEDFLEEEALEVSLSGSNKGLCCTVLGDFG